jgi:RNA-binding protein PNO1
MERDINIIDEMETGKDNNQEDIEGDENLLMNVEIDNVMKNLNENRENAKNNVSLKQDYRRVIVPQNRMKPLKENWTTIVKALVEHMKIQVKMNTKKKCVEIRSSETTEDISAVQKCEEFLKAFMCGFDLQDSIAMLRLEDLYLETFEIKDGI